MEFFFKHNSETNGYFWILDEIKKDLSLGEMPFQLQVTYTASDGAKCMRVFGKKQEFSRSRDKVEENLEVEEIMFCNAAQKMSSHFLSGDAVAAKYKSRQMRNFEKGGRVKATEEFSRQQCFIDGRSKKDRVTALNDEEAKCVYNAKKITSSRMKNAN